ncbi:MAG TPA: glycosyl transferase family 2 [Flavobacteriaceae bacterium]|nr:glycosyl transferase family 2 [Flavobacteriaceae bacterium]
MPELYSFIIPVYNRPDELGELLHSIAQLDQAPLFEVIVIDDGSTLRSKEIIERYDFLDIHYYFKENTGPGDSRNFGMRKAVGDYFIILDSDCILAADYLSSVDRALNEHFVDCFGGPDAAHPSFNLRQRTISFIMTSFWTTGGIRGNKKNIKRFEPRSFNMGLSRKAFEQSLGFGHLHPGEDPELVHRLWEMGFKTSFIQNALVYHKRRITWSSYARQIYRFGLARSILNSWRPQNASWVFWLPSFMVLIGICSIGLFVLKYYELAYLVLAYALFIACVGMLKIKSIMALVTVPWAFGIQSTAYAIGFFQGWVYLRVLKRDPKKEFSHMFFN